ncbi:MAG TPA: hypothetical protein PK648_02520 [Verrucomicrobiales bacterium]|nr:hypothetical protein [Verrucomicrobiales bacterium]
MERSSRSQRYSINRWQFEMLQRFDGKRSFEEISKQVYQIDRGAFTAMGLLNFYNWLYDEDLVLCECESIFELVTDDSENGLEPASGSRDSFMRQLLSDSRVQWGLKISALIVFSLSVIRLVYVAAPIFEPPMDRLYAEAGKMLHATDKDTTAANSERSALQPAIESVELASRVNSPIELPAPDEVMPQAATEPTIRPAPVVKAPVPSKADLEQTRVRIEELRVALEECRIRRDEFYLQNDESGYRQEVQRMTNLAKEIGDIEDSL